MLKKYIKKYIHEFIDSINTILEETYGHIDILEEDDNDFSNISDMLLYKSNTHDLMDHIVNLGRLIHDTGDDIYHYGMCDSDSEWGYKFQSMINYSIKMIVNDRTRLELIYY